MITFRIVTPVGPTPLGMNQTAIPFPLFHRYTYLNRVAVRAKPRGFNINYVGLFQSVDQFCFLLLIILISASVSVSENFMPLICCKHKVRILFLPGCDVSHTLGQLPRHLHGLDGFRRTGLAESILLWAAALLGLTLTICYFR